MSNKINLYGKFNKKRIIVSNIDFNRCLKFVKFAFFVAIFSIKISILNQNAKFLLLYGIKPLFSQL